MTFIGKNNLRIKVRKYKFYDIPKILWILERSFKDFDEYQCKKFLELNWFYSFFPEKLYNLFGKNHR